MQGDTCIIRQMWVHVAMASHWARHLWRVDIQRRGAIRKENNMEVKAYIFSRVLKRENRPLQEVEAYIRRQQRHGALYR